MCSTSSASPQWWSRVRRGRKAQIIKEIPFKDHWPLILKNQLSTRRGQDKEAYCLQETLAFITCLKDHNNSHELCIKEGEIVQKCYSNYVRQNMEKANMRKAVSDFKPGKRAKDMSATELNKILSHFPHKLK